MPDERFREAVSVTETDGVLIDRVWAAVRWRNRWRLRAWQAVNVLRALIGARRRLPRLPR